MYTIFSDDIPIYLTDDPNYSLKSNSFHYDKNIVPHMINSIRSENLQEVYLYHTDLKALWKSFKKHFFIEKAAGGLVKNDRGENLFIFRLNRWDLPKGKIEKDESKKECAIREVMEECGLRHVTLSKKILKTYHLFTRNQRQVLKITHWYKMHTIQEGDLIPQLAEDITKVAFLNSEETKKAIEKTYGNIKLLFQHLEDI